MRDLWQIHVKNVGTTFTFSFHKGKGPSNARNLNAAISQKHILHWHWYLGFIHIPGINFYAARSLSLSRHDCRSNPVTFEWWFVFFCLLNRERWWWWRLWRCRWRWCWCVDDRRQGWWWEILFCCARIQQPLLWIVNEIVLNYKLNTKKYYNGVCKTSCSFWNGL